MFDVVKLYVLSKFIKINECFLPRMNLGGILNLFPLLCLYLFKLKERVILEKYDFHGQSVFEKTSKIKETLAFSCINICLFMIQNCFCKNDLYEFKSVEYKFKIMQNGLH